MLSTFHADLAAFGFGFHPPSPHHPFSLLLAQISRLRRIGMLRKWFCILNNVLGRQEKQKKNKKRKATLAAVPKVPKERIEPKKGQKGVSDCMDGLIINSSSGGSGSIIIILVVV